MPTPNIRRGAGWLPAAGALLALALGAWLLRRPEPGPAGSPFPAPSGSGQGSVPGGDPPPPRPPPPTAPGARERATARLERGDAEFLASYEALGAATVPSGLLSFSRVLLVAGFPEEALRRYGGILADPSAAFPLKLAALDALSVLARGGLRAVETLYLGVLERAGEHPRVLEWAAAFLGRYYDGDGVRSALLRRALDGSPAAVESLSYSAASDLSGVRPSGDRHAEALRRAAERVALLRSADARLRLREILQKTDDAETADWAILSAARAGYAEAVEDIRRALPRLGRKIVPVEPETWEFWEAKGQDPRVAQAVEALRRLGSLTSMEERLVRHYVLDGSRASAEAALEARRDDPRTRDLVELFRAGSR